MLDLIRNIKRCEQGATAVEYGLIVSLVVVAIMVAIGNVGDATVGMWNYVSNEITTSTNG
jgi:pilus assembly protein Flp/PilA